jgi:chromate reductase
MYPINEEVIVSNADKKVGEDGKVHDEKTRDKIKGLLESLIEWTKVLGKPPVGT